MPIIRPISDLRNNFNQISEICHKEGQPVFVTKNGQGNLVVMSHALYEKQQALLELYQKLGEAESQSASNSPRISHNDLMKKLRLKANE
jgi:prevent-host-death family protein